MIKQTSTAPFTPNNCEHWSSVSSVPSSLLNKNKAFWEDVDMIQETISHLYYQLNFLIFKINLNFFFFQFCNNFQDSLWRVLCGHSTFKPFPPYISTIKRWSVHLLWLLCFKQLPLSFAWGRQKSRSLLSLISLVGSGDSATSPSGAWQLLLAVGTAVMQHYTHMWMVAKGGSMHLPGREKRGLQP